jgi:hypothetical protein
VNLEAAGNRTAESSGSRINLSLHQLQSSGRVILALPFTLRKDNIEIEKKSGRRAECRRSGEAKETIKNNYIPFSSAFILILLT